MEPHPVPAPPRWASSAAPAVRITAWVRGQVQGVGFRWWTRSRGLELDLVGLATNLRDGRVEVVAEGPRAACDALLAWLCEQPSTQGPPRHGERGHAPLVGAVGRASSGFRER